MATAIRILGWRSSNLRCPDHDISFERTSEQAYPIILIQMPNGTGKTTTLNLLRAALSGEATAWSAETVLDYAKPGETTGEFQVRLLHNQQRLTIMLRFDFAEASVKYLRTIGRSGMQEGFYLPPPLQNYLRKDFVRFFIFDGEFARGLLDRDSPNAQSVIEELFQLHHFTELSRQAREYWDRQVGKAGATEEKGLTQRRNRVEFLRQRIDLLKKEQADYQAKRTRAQTSLDQRRKKIKESLGNQKLLGKRLLAAEANLGTAKAAKEAATQALFAEFRNPHSLSLQFAQEILDFKASLDRAKLPENTAREFFEELSQEAECVCGTILNEKRRGAIRARAPQYLGSEDISLLNSLKSDVAYFIGNKPKTHEQRLNVLADELQIRVQAENAARTNRDAIEKEGVGAEPGLEQANKEIETLQKKIADLDMQLEKYDEDSDDSVSDKYVSGISCLTRRLSDAERKLGEVTATLELKQKRDILVQIFEQAQNNARKAISEQLTIEANANFSKLMPYNKVRIKEINRFLVLDSKSGASEGETLAIAYAFISTLLTRGEIQLPFIIDSPAGKIDLHVRPKVAALVPQLACQFIAFVISSERQGFVQPLELEAKNEVQHITLFRKDGSSMTKRAQKIGNHKESQDGIWAYDGAFFHQFQGDKEA